MPQSLRVGRTSFYSFPIFSNQCVCTCSPAGFPNLGGREAFKRVAEANVRIKITFFSIGEAKIVMKYQFNNKPNLKIIIMIMVKISAWGSPNLQYLDMGGRGSKRLGNPVT